MATRDTEVGRLLEAYADGDPSAFNRLVPLVYDELRRVARRHLRRIDRGQTLNTTALVHEVYLKMAGQRDLRPKDRAHFLAISACAMRQIIISRARARAAAKRGGGIVPLELDENQAAAQKQAEWLLDLDRVLERLRERDERLARVFECRFFAGLSEEETAEALDTSLRSAQRDWMRARAWIRAELFSAGEAGAPQI